VPGRTLLARLVTVSVYVWSPFVAERAVIGHWPVLLAYSVLPWLMVAARGARTGPRVPMRLLWLVPLGCLSAGAGLACGLTLMAFGWRRGAVRTNSVLAAIATAANAPWLVSGLLHASSAISTAVGARVFALNDEGRLPGPLAAVTGGGIWNAEVVPASRSGALGWAALALLGGLAVVGLRSCAGLLGRRDLLAHTVCWGVGWGLAVLTYALPGVVAWFVGHVPGAGLVRDGSRLLLLCLPLLALAVGHGAEQVVARLRTRVQSVAVSVGLVLLPVALMPDAANGVSGRLHPVEYPASYTAMREAVSGTAGGGDLLVLPFTAYRAPAWNGGRSVLDPLGRYQPHDYVVADDLVVNGRTLAGEDPRAKEVRRALAETGPDRRARALGRAGIGLVSVDGAAPGHAPKVAGVTVLDRGGLTLVRLDGTGARRVPRLWLLATAVAWATYLALPVTCVARRFRRRTPIRR
jgi:hypothetical protein